MVTHKPKHPATAPALVSPGAQNSSHEVWLRLATFLSLRSPNTQDTYRRVLAEWCQFLNSQIGTATAAQAILKVQDLDAIRYRAWLEKRPGEKPRSQRQAAENRQTAISTDRVRRSKKKEGLEHTLSNATIAKKFAALRRMYRVLIAADLGLRINPFDTDRVPAPPKDSGRKRPTEMLDYKLVQRVLETPDQSKPRGRRDRAILALLFGAGLRRSEVIGLRVGDVRKTQRGTYYLYLRATKAKKDAEQAVPNWALKPLLQWKEERQSMGAKDGDCLFIAYTGRGGTKATREPISATALYLDFKRHCAAAGVASFVSPHSARATAITKLLDQGLSHRDVRTFSRHASVQMVEAYDKRRTSVDESPAKDLEFDR